MCKLAKVWVFVVACLISFAANAQVAVISGQVINQNGQPLPYAQVRVCSVTSTGVPCNPTATIYQDYGLTVQATNPWTTDQYGNYTLYAGTLPAPNLYTVQFSPESGVTWAYVVNGPYLSASGGTVTGFINALGYNGVPEADQCSGVDANAKINTCAAMIPNGGFEDARGFGATTQTSTTALTAISLPTRPITLEFNPATIYIENVAFSPGAITAGTACIIPIGEGSAIETPGWNQALNIRLGPLAATYDVVCNAAQDGTQESFRIDGLGIWGNPSATMKGSLLHVKNTYVGTQIKDVLTYQPFGTALTDEGGSDHFYLDDNFSDSSPAGGYAGSVVNLTCPNDLTFQNGAIQFNGANNPLLTIQGYTSTGPTECVAGSNAYGVHFYNVDFEISAATVGSFSGAATNVDPIQCTDCSDVVWDKLILWGIKGSGQNHVVDIMSSGANGQARGPVEIDNMQVSPVWAGLAVINNTVGSAFVSPELASVIPAQNGSDSYGVSKYRWVGSGASQASAIDYEDVKSFTSMTAGITNGAYSPIYTNLATAMAAAGTTGSLGIPANYTGTDTFTNPHNLRVDDRRPYNPNNRANFVQLPGTDGTVPQTTIKGSDYGMVCNGVHDDTAAWQAAQNAAVTLIGGAGGGITSMGPATVELPQGRCEISNTITMAGEGSVIGSANGTWVYPLEPWLGSTGDLLAVTDNYVPNTVPNTHNGINRRVEDINFEYNFNATAHTAIHVFSQYGSTSSLPYPSSQNDPQAYQPNGVIISGNTIYAMDTGIQLDDCGQCVVQNNQVSFVRAAYVNNGNDYDVVLSNDFFLAGTFSYTPISSSLGPNLGVYSVSAGKYYCNSPGTGAACTGGTVTQVISSPQSLTLQDTEVEGFERCGYIVNALAFVMNGAGMDNCGPSTGSSYPGLYIGQLKFAQIYYSFFDVNGTGANVIEVAGVSNAQGSGLENQDGLWITGNYIYGYQATTGSGILFDAPAEGSAARRNVYVTDNQFTNVAYGVDLLGGLTYSVLRGNYGNTIGTALFNFNNATGFSATKLEDNTLTTAVPVYVLTNAPGLIIGYNQSPSQVSGTFTWTGTGCSIAGGTVGTQCSVAITGAVPFADTNYHVTGCSIVGATGAVSIGTWVTPTLGGTVTVYETAMSTAAVSGGTVYCTVVDS